MVAHRRLPAQVAIDAQEGLKAYRLRRRIPIMGILDCTGEPGQERIEMFPYPTQDITMDLHVQGGEPTMLTVEVIEHVDVPHAGALEVLEGEAG